VNAYDPNGDTLTYALVDAPTGMSMTAEGVISWRPSLVGNYAVSVSVSDGINTPVVQV